MKEKMHERILSTRQGKDVHSTESLQRLSRILQESKQATKDPTYLIPRTPAESPDATVSRFYSAHDKIQELRLPFNEIKANSALLDRKRINFTQLPLNIPIPPLVQGSPMAAPLVRNLYDKKSNTSNLINKLLNLPLMKLTNPELRFKIMMEAAASNFELLKTAAYDLKELCNKNHSNRERSATTFRSEFKEVQVLEKLFRQHPRWEKFKG